MKGYRQRQLLMNVTLRKGFSLLMVLLFGLAMIRACGKKWMARKFSLLCMKKGW
jgi:hypothetical protein